MGIEEKEGWKVRSTNKSHHSGCLVVTHHPVHVAVPVQLAGMGDRTAVAPREVMGTGKRKAEHCSGLGVLRQGH